LPVRDPLLGPDPFWEAIGIGAEGTGGGPEVLVGVGGAALGGAVLVVVLGSEAPALATSPLNLAGVVLTRFKGGFLAELESAGPGAGAGVGALAAGIGGTCLAGAAFTLGATPLGVPEIEGLSACGTAGGCLTGGNEGECPPVVTDGRAVPVRGLEGAAPVPAAVD